MKKQKFKLLVIFGEQACEEAEYVKLETLRKKIRRGDVDGCINTFTFDTEDDRAEAVRMLEASEGWQDNNWIFPEKKAELSEK